MYCIYIYIYIQSKIRGEATSRQVRLQVYKEIMFLGLHTQSHWDRGFTITICYVCWWINSSNPTIVIHYHDISTKKTKNTNLVCLVIHCITPTYLFRGSLPITNLDPNEHAHMPPLGLGRMVKRCFASTPWTCRKSFLTKRARSFERSSMAAMALVKMTPRTIVGDG